MFSHRNSKTSKEVSFSLKTDALGVYSIQPTTKIQPKTVLIQMSLGAKGFVNKVSFENDVDAVLAGKFTTVKVARCRKLVGRIVDQHGKPVTHGVVRFQANDEAMTRTWDSYPVKIDSKGRFTVNPPTESACAGVVYADGYAPQFVEREQCDQEKNGDIVVLPGKVMKGRVLDKSGQGIAGTVIGVRSERYIELHAVLVSVADAVRTDEEGYFTLPPLRGEVRLTVSDGAPQYSKRRRLTGKKPPEIEPVVVDSDTWSAEELIVLQEE